MAMTKRTTILAILDGWGIGRHDESNPIYVAQPPTFAALRQQYPVTSLQASGIAVGLPWGEVGNSEVGHLTLGAGKILYQYYPKITMAIRDGSFFENQVIKDACAHARETGGALHLAGLLSKGNVHASLDHLLALIKFANNEQVPRIRLHLFSDGKDSPPRSLQKFLAEVPADLIATLIGRYYAMDRNGNWSLTETAYQTMTAAAGQLVTDPAPVIEATYRQNLTEEYLPPLRFGADAAAADAGRIHDGDSLFFFNYREDSIRQLASSFILKNFDHFQTVPFSNLHVATMSHYNDEFKVPVAFPADTVENPIGKVLSDRGLAQLRIAETYKYAHVTYFFNGLREPPFPGEYRTLIPSATGIHPEDHPEMMASAVTDRLIEAIGGKGFDFILVNYSNADTIGHTANYPAALEAVRVLDREIARVVKAATDADALLFITADHGNLEEMINPATGLPESQHDPSPVPFYAIAREFAGKQFVNSDTLETETLGALDDVAPTILAAMGIPRPTDMTGKNLIDNLV